MKYNFKIQLVSKMVALEMIQKYHYSNTLPKINKYFCGFFLDDELVGIVTLGYGTQPLNTIKKIFPTLKTSDYLEIGRMCMTEYMPKNSESQMLSLLIKWIKHNIPSLKILFTWADGMLGKPGYVYQASGFLYAGYSKTDIYMKNGIKIHPRSMKKILSPNDKRKGVRPTHEQMINNGFEHYKGKQFKYLKFLCSKVEKKRLMKESLVELNTNYPKNKDLKWAKLDLSKNKWVACEMPNYISDKININKYLGQQSLDLFGEEEE